MKPVRWRGLRLVVAPGAYAPRSDTDLLAGALEDGGRLDGRCALDLCTGTAAVALTAAALGAQSVAVDTERRAVLAARLNARLNGLRVHVRRGDLFGVLRDDEHFDVITANPPYLPEAPSAQRQSGCWDAGPDGRAVLDRICAQAGPRLRPGGRVLVVQSDLAGIDQTIRALREAGLTGVEPVAEHVGPYGPIAAERVGQEEGLERLVVIAAARRLPVSGGRLRRSIAA